MPRGFRTKPKNKMDQTEPFLDMSKLYISSSDSLKREPTDQTIPGGWNDRPPLFVTTDNDDLLKGVSWALASIQSITS